MQNIVSKNKLLENPYKGCIKTEWHIHKSLNLKAYSITTLITSVHLGRIENFSFDKSCIETSCRVEICKKNILIFLTSIDFNKIYKKKTFLENELYNKKYKNSYNIYVAIESRYY